MTSASTQDAARILVVDDERVIREILAEFLSLEGFSVNTVEDGEKALTELRLHPYDLLITDLKMPRLSGLQLLEKIEAERLGVLTVLMTGFGTVETAIEAMKKGAYDYLLKPFKVEEVIHVVERALYRQRLQAENIRLREALTIYKVSEAIALSHDIEQDPRRRPARRDRRGQGRRRDAPPARSALGPLRGARQGRRRRRAAPTRPALARVRRAHRAVRAGRADPRARRQGVAVLHRAARCRRTSSSFVAVPLQVRGDMVGVLNVFSFTPGKKFDEGHRKMLAVLASRAASAIDNARLYGELRRHQREPRHGEPLARGDVPADRRRASRRRSRRATCTRAATPSASPCTPRCSRAASRCPTPRSAASCRRA